MNRFEKSTPPNANPMGGIRMSSTNEVTILPNATPITTPTAKSTTLPLMMNSLNSLYIGSPLPDHGVSEPKCFTELARGWNAAQHKRLYVSQKRQVNFYSTRLANSPRETLRGKR